MDEYIALCINKIRRTIPLIILLNLIISMILTPAIANTQHLSEIRPEPLSEHIVLVETQWITRYNGSGNNYDDAKALDIDNEGNVYVTGTSKGADDKEIPGTFDIVTIKYNKTGSEQWVARWNNPVYQFNDFASSLAVDAIGNVYVTGKSLVGEMEYGIVILKYNSLGEKQWEDFYYGGHSSVLDYPEKIVLDGEGSVYVAGSIRGENNQFDMCTLKYSVDGVRQWVRCYDGEAHGNDTAGNIAVKDNAVVVVGEVATQNRFTDYVTMKYSSDGDLLWLKTYNGADTNDRAYAVALDGMGNIYVTGASNNGETWYAYDYATIKYSSDGVLLWVQRYDALANVSSWASCDYAYDILLDSFGHVVVTGKCIKIDGLVDYFGTVCYTIDGSLVWFDWYYVYRGSTPALAIDRCGNVYICGSCAGGPTYLDYFTIRYNVSGTVEWVQSYNGPGNYWDKGADIAVDDRGNVYVTGYSIGVGTVEDYMTIRYHQEESPNIPSAPTPPDCATNIPINATLSWSGGDPDSDDTVTYDVYFGSSSSPPKVESNQSHTSYDPSLLENGTTYYWKVVAWDSTNYSSSGPIWRFTTITYDTTPPVVAIQKPTSGYVYFADHVIWKRVFSQQPLIFGSIIIEVNATDTESGVRNVEFSIDDTVNDNDTTAPYTYMWNQRVFSFQSHKIKINIYDNAGNYNTTELQVRKFF